MKNNYDGVKYGDWLYNKKIDKIGKVTGMYFDVKNQRNEYWIDFEHDSDYYHVWYPKDVKFATKKQLLVRDLKL